jgi:hypothetical protein
MSDCPKCTLEPSSPTTLTEARDAILDSVHNLLKLDAELSTLKRSLLERFCTLYPKATTDLQGAIAAAQNDGLLNAASCLIAVARDLVDEPATTEGADHA